MELARSSAASTSGGPAPLPEPPSPPVTEDRAMRLLTVLADRPDLLQHVNELGREADRLGQPNPDS